MIHIFLCHATFKHCICLSKHNFDKNAIFMFRNGKKEVTENDTF